MDIAEYAEKLIGRKLYEFEKRIVKDLAIRPRDSRLYMIIGRRGGICVCNGPKTERR